MAPSFTDFEFKEGTYTFRGRDAIIAAIIRKVDATFPINTASREWMQLACTKLSDTVIPVFEPTTDADLRKGEEKPFRDPGDKHYRSKRAADALAATEAEFVAMVKKTWQEAVKEGSQEGKTLLGNREHAHVV